MKRYAACAVFHTPSHHIMLHRCLSICETLESAENLLINTRVDQYCHEMYIQEIDPEVGIVAFEPMGNINKTQVRIESNLDDPEWLKGK
jgi:hypothetical protein